MFRLEVLPARYGDCLLIEYGKDRTHRVLIDGGAAGVYKRSLKPRLELIGETERQDFELLIVTHVDYDHIKGILELAHDDELKFAAKDVWFNGFRHIPKPNEENEILAGKHGEELTDLLLKNGQSWNQIGFAGEAVLVPDEPDDLPVVELDGGLKLTLLAPTIPALAELLKDWEKSCKDLGKTPDELEEAREEGRFELLGDDAAEKPASPDIEKLLKKPFKEDHSAANGSSIAVLAEYEDRRVLLAGDAHPTQLVETIARLGEDKLKLDACKLPHHGSRGSVSADLIKSLDCKDYIFSTNGDQFKHPHQEAVARVIQHGGNGVRLHFNYSSDQTKIWADRDLQKKHSYSAVYPQGLNYQWEE